MFPASHRHDRRHLYVPLGLVRIVLRLDLLDAHLHPILAEHHVLFLHLVLGVRLDLHDDAVDDEADESENAEDDEEDDEGEDLLEGAHCVRVKGW